MFKKIIAFVLCLCTLLSVTACSNTNVGGSGTIQISYWKSGWGDEWLYDIKDAFEAKNPNYTVEIDSSAADGDIANLLPIPDENQYDIIMGSSTDSKLKSVYYENLDDVVTAKNAGETKTVGEKIGSQLLSYIQDADGHYKSLFWGTGYYGIVYNKDIFDKYEYEEPRTTDELNALIEVMKDYDSVVPFIHFENGGYLHSMLWTWAIQYAGADNFYNLTIDPDLSKLTDDENGVLKGLEVIFDIVNDKNNYYTGSDGMPFTTAQATFLAPSSRSGKEIAMMVNGPWLEQEMQNSEDELNKNNKMMKTPVISSIIDKCNTIGDDQTLSEVIKAIDEGKTSYSGVSQTDFNTVKTAREVEMTNAINLEFCVPNYSDNITGTKEFIKFFYSDEALKIWANTTKTLSLVDFDDETIAIDTKDFSMFNKSMLDLSKKSSAIIENRTNKAHTVFVNGGLSVVEGYESGLYVSSMSGVKSKPDSKIKSASDVWNKIKSNIEENWESSWANIGLQPPTK